MDWNRLESQWTEVLTAVENRGGKTSPLPVEQPCTAETLVDIEIGTGIPIPVSFREVLLQFSRKVELRWFLPEDFELPSAADEATSGELYWSHEELVSINKSMKEWANIIAPNPVGSYDLIWHNKFAFQSVGNGDLLAIDILKADNQPVVYLSHDDSHGHGFILGSDFQDFIRRWSHIGCAGGEDWKWMPFVNDPDSLLDSNGENARIWRESLGLRK